MRVPRPAGRVEEKWRSDAGLPVGRIAGRVEHCYHNDFASVLLVQHDVREAGYDSLADFLMNGSDQKLTATM